MKSPIVLMQLPDIHSHEVQFDALHDRAVMAEPVALKAVEVVVKITSYLHLELVVTMSVLLETLNRTNETLEFLHYMFLLRATKLL